MRRKFTVKASKRIGRSRITAARKENFLGLPNVYIRYYNTWADPQIEYRGIIYSYADVEDYMIADYEDYLDSTGMSDDSYSDLSEYMRDNRNMVYDILDELYANGQYTESPYDTTSDEFPFKNIRPN